MVLHTARPSLATLPEFPSIGEALAFQINGLIVVFIALGSIWGLLEIMGLFFRQRSTTRAKVAATPAPQTASPAPLSAAPAAPPTPAALAPELTAVIAASIATVLQQPHRIRSISADAPPPTWAHEGRREIFGSHRIR